MRIATEISNLTNATPTDLLIVGLAEGTGVQEGAIGSVDRALNGAIRRAVTDGLITGKLGETYLLSTAGALPQPVVLVVGLGSPAKCDAHHVRQAAQAAGAAALALKPRTVSTVAHGVGTNELAAAAAVEATLVATAYGLYRYTAYHSEPAVRVEALHLVSDDAGAQVTAALRRARATWDGVEVARDLVNTPPADKRPMALVARIQELGQQFGFAVEVWDEKRLREIGAGGILAVGRASSAPPAVVLMRLTGSEGEPLGLLGKGITFDAGGLQIKTAEGMRTMKSDMAGAAAVIGAMVALAQLERKTPVVAVAMCAENMISGDAFRPGDILRMLSGKTVEMANADAEGRLVLADGVEILRREKVRGVVDLATLTGAQVVALGDVRAGAISNDAALMEDVRQASELAGERIWEMPHDEDYRHLLDSRLADIRNVGSHGPGAGMITGGLFVGAFSEGLPWVHLDIAGPSFKETEKATGTPGGTGFGVQTLIRLLTD